MNWIKRNLFWLVGLLFFVLLLLGSLLLLKSQIRERNRAAAELEVQRTERERLINRSNYPKNKNVVQMRQDNDQLEKKIDVMLSRLAKAQVPDGVLTGVKFRETVSNRTLMLSRLARQEGVGISVDYLFGFERYERTIPEDQNVPLLMKQLNVVEEIASILFRSHLVLLDRITRVEFEDYDAEEVSKGKRRKPGEYTEMPNGYRDIQNDPAKIYTMMPFEVQFATDAEGLRNFLNNLAMSKYVLIPAYIKVKSEDVEVLKGKVKKPEIGPEGTLVTPLSEEAEIAEKTTKYVAGLKNTNVRLRIDWYEFRPTVEKAGSKREEKAERSDGKDDRKKEVGAEGSEKR